MASENFFKSNVVTGLAAGVGATLLAPVLLPILANIAKPLTKAAIKAGIVCYEKGVESVAEFGEVMDDLVAEARSEMGSEAVPAAAVAARASQTGDASQGPASAGATPTDHPRDTEGSPGAVDAQPGKGKGSDSAQSPPSARGA